MKNYVEKMFEIYQWDRSDCNKSKCIAIRVAHLSTCMAVSVLIYVLICIVRAIFTEMEWSLPLCYKVWYCYTNSHLEVPFIVIFHLERFACKDF